MGPERVVLVAPAIEAALLLPAALYIDWTGSPPNANAADKRGRRRAPPACQPPPDGNGP